MTKLKERGLRNKGYDVRENIGNCGFNIDVGILKEGSVQEYSLGIDVNYGVKSGPCFLRDSFKNREPVLSKRGWKIYNLWLQDWMFNRIK